jgi:hypothetical protein
MPYASKLFLHTREVCDGKMKNRHGKRKSAEGFFWRWVGSDKLPQDFIHFSKTVLASAAEAAKKLGLGMNGVCCWCRNEGNARGFWWRYHITKFDTPQKEKGLLGRC